MPPRKRKQAAAAGTSKKAKKGGGGTGGKDTKVDEVIAGNEAPSKTTGRTPKPDKYCPVAHSAQVLDDYDCMLNQTNINANNNKFYIIQLLKDKSEEDFYVWTRWGRVGEIGQNHMTSSQMPLCRDTAIKEFEKKFKDKTKNEWNDRANFVPKKGKYTLLEMDDDEDDEQDGGDDKQTGSGDNKACIIKNELYAACSLDQPTKELVSLLFDDNMFMSYMAAMDLDVKKMPLGKLSKSQIAKGFDALIAIEEALKANKPSSTLERLSSAFYTQIPHSFGRQRPPVLNTIMLVEKKKEMLLVLSDIELAQTLQKKDQESKQIDTSTITPHPIDEKYLMLNCKLSLLNRSAKEHKIIETYIENTKNCKWRICHIWMVDRDGESERFNEHDDLQNRKLLWHGTNVAVVAAILNSGLRIMPHSGGRVGRGIYFASEHAKSAGFVHFANNHVGIMFLTEVALGRENTITQDNCSLIKAPPGFDSIVARGRREPDPKKDTTIKFDGKNVIVPQGKPVPSEHKESSFYESEYLIYKESQAKIRYLITFSLH